MKPRTYGCEEARADVDYFFKRVKKSPKKEEALNRAIEHMTKGTTRERHNVSCRKCWDYKEGMKKDHCGG